MPRIKREPLIAGALLMILVGLIAHRLRASQTPGPTTPPTPASPPSPAAPLSDEAAPAPAAPTPVLPALTVPARDPFQRPTALEQLLMPSPSETPPPAMPTAVAMPPLTLQGIFWGTHPHRAIVNDQILTEGDQIAGARVVAIRPDGVTVEFQGTRSVLRLPVPGGPRRDNQEYNPWRGS